MAEAFFHGDIEQGNARPRVKFDESLSDDLGVAEYGWWQACNYLERSGYALHGLGSTNIKLLLLLAYATH